MRAESLADLSIEELKQIEGDLDRASIRLWDVDSTYSKRLPSEERERLATAYETTENLRTDVYKALARQAYPCAYCEGEGQAPAPDDPDDLVTCPDCGGQGYVAKEAS